MRKSIVAAATIAAVLSIGTPTRNATAMSVVTPGQLGLAGGVADSVEKTVLICGPWGCHWRPRYWGWYRPYPYPYPYWGWRRHYWWGWHRHRWWGWHRHWRRW
jgi:hypothetical protein